MMAGKRERLKELFKKHKWILSSATTITVISITSGIITILVFLSGISNIPDAIKKIYHNTSKVSEISFDFYTAKIVLPARMNCAKIFVDGQPAILIEQTAIIATVRVQQKSTGHRFTVRKGDDVCEKQQSVNQDNIIIYPCQ